MARIEELYEAVLTGDKSTAEEVTRHAIGTSVDPQALIDQSMIPAMDEVGRRFEEEEYFVPELLLSARAMKAALKIVNPLLSESGGKHKGCIVLGTVKGDLHDIGKNLVSSMLEGAGFRVVDLGTDVSPEQFVAAVEENDANLIGISALLTATMPSMKSTIEALEAAGIRNRVKVMVGGAPLSTDYAKEINADAYADNANAAVRTAQDLTGA
ncbi:MAG: cobalamin-binding protein [bacterium]|nr:cobalamin-binding protein [bacterium]MCP5067703.1 cobalamin-binding protein [bacterium]